MIRLIVTDYAQLWSGWNRKARADYSASGRVEAEDELACKAPIRDLEGIFTPMRVEASGEEDEEALGTPAMIVGGLAMVSAIILFTSSDMNVFSMFSCIQQLS